MWLPESIRPQGAIKDVNGPVNLCITVMITGKAIGHANETLYVHDILLFEDLSDNRHILPFFADGYPGIVFCDAPGGVYLEPKHKKLSPLFLYGQTLMPIELDILGGYRMIIFQLYPYAARILLGIDPRELNDDCYDLTQLPHPAAPMSLVALRHTNSTREQVAIMSAFLESLAENSCRSPDESIMLAIDIILQNRGALTIKKLRDKLCLTERTFERRFLKEIGVTPKIFCKIIQFQNSIHQITASPGAGFMDVVYENGFSDQSHFIRTFKKYTGLTPSEFQNLPEFIKFRKAGY